MKTSARYHFDSKTEMNEWIKATEAEQAEQAEIEGDPDYQLYIYNETTQTEVLIRDANSYFPEFDSKNCPENNKYQVVV